MSENQVDVIVVRAVDMRQSRWIGEKAVWEFINRSKGRNAD